MANGTIKQFRGPFSENTTINIGSNSNCIIGVSVGQDDFMSWNSADPPIIPPGYEKDIKFTINGSTIHLGRTYMYQTQQQINDTVLTFPQGAPPSTKVQIVYCERNNSIEEE